MDLPMVELIKSAKMVGVMHEADHAYSIRSTWWLDRLATDVPLPVLVICPVLLPITSICRILVLFYDLDCRILEF